MRGRLKVIRDPGMRVLENAVVRLEPQVSTHADAMFEVLGDPAIYEHENEPPPTAEWLRTRFNLLESRLSPDATQLWLNWVIRLPSTPPIGFVQATVYPSHRAAIAYVLGSRYWGKGLATAAVRLMAAELASRYEVTMLSAVFKRPNLRSRRLLERLGFALAAPGQHQAHHADVEVEVDELLMMREAVVETGRRA